MFLQKAMKQGRNVHGISSSDACSKICPYNIKGVWSHSMGDMPTPFLFTNSCITAHSIAAKLSGINLEGPLISLS